MQLGITDLGVFELSNPWEFNRLELVVDPMEPERFRDLAARLGDLEGDDHIWLAPGVLKFLSHEASNPDWNTGFDDMISAAAEYGWVKGGKVRAHIVRGAPPARVSSDQFRDAMRRLAASVCAVTTGTMDDPAGMVASSVVSICAEPPALGVFVHKTSSSLPRLVREGRFAVNILTRQHADLLPQFTEAPQGIARFEGAGWEAGPMGLPVLPSALASIECKIATTITLGTHLLLVGRIETSHTQDDEPMVYFDANVL
ncbi:MAG: flavin reductase [Pseudooceanicola sp.]|jgi:flavin reductase (DIM6/NTAB) family NADH-FMN oxidoreductase RutF|nr:flavin reductase [Pseudooceanicola sp.]